MQLSSWAGAALVPHFAANIAFEAYIQSFHWWPSTVLSLITCSIQLNFDQVCRIKFVNINRFCSALPLFKVYMCLHGT